MNIPEGFAQVNHIFGGGALPRGAQITYGVSLVPDPPVAALTAIAADLHDAWVANFIDYLPSLSELRATRLKIGPTETGPFAVWLQTDVGTWASAPDSPQVAVLITKQTALGGRTNRGRFFWPAPAEVGTNSGGVVAPANQAVYQSKADAWLADVAAVTGIGNMVLLHNDPLAVPTDVDSLAVSSTLATQRRRLRKVGGRRRIVV